MTAEGTQTTSDGNFDLSRTVYAARGIGILLVLLGHAIVVATIRFPDPFSRGPLTLANTFVYSFHMHFFFFLAGWSSAVFSHDRSISDALGSRVRRLLVPYLVFSLIVAAIKSIAPQLATEHAHSDAGLLAQVFLYPRSNPMSVLWFLHSMFLMSVAAALLPRRMPGAAAWAVLAAMLALQAVPTTDNILGYKDIVTFSIPFFLGIAFPGLWRRVVSVRNRWLLFLWPVLFVAHFSLRGTADRFFLMTLTGVLGIPAVLALSRLANDVLPDRTVGLLERFGRLSLQVYLLSYFVEHGLRILLLNVLGVALPSPAWLCIDLAVTPISCLGLAMLLGRLPVLPGLLFGEKTRARGTSR